MSKQKLPKTGKKYASKPKVIRQKSSRHRAARARIKQKVRLKSPLHRRLVLHPTTLFGLLVLGVLLAGLTYRSFAADYTVNAKVPAPPLATGATITSPTYGQQFTAKPITVTGSCPDDSYVKLFRNGMFSGTAVCVSNAFQIQSDLFVGTNDLQAQAYNITDAPGPQTPVVRVSYAPPVPPAGTAGPAGPGNKYIPPAQPGSKETTGPLLLWGDFQFSVFSTTQPFRWTLRFEHGTAPFATTVDWGDGQNTNLTVPDTQEFTITHSYSQPGNYSVVVSGHDSTGQTVSMQLVALIKLPGQAGLINEIVGKSGSGSNSLTHWLWWAWPTYLIVSLMAISYWLGERREIMYFLKNSKFKVAPAKPRHRH